MSTAASITINEEHVEDNQKLQELFTKYVGANLQSYEGVC